MGRTWMFEETGEVKISHLEWVNLAGLPYYNTFFNGALPILKITEYPSNPLEPIREVWERYSEELKMFIGLAEIGEVSNVIGEISQAIQKCMEIAGQK